MQQLFGQVDIDADTRYHGRVRITAYVGLRQHTAQLAVVRDEVIWPFQ